MPKYIVSWKRQVDAPDVQAASAKARIAVMYDDLDVRQAEADDVFIRPDGVSDEPPARVEYRHSHMRAQPDWHATDPHDWDVAPANWTRFLKSMLIVASAAAIVWLVLEAMI